MKKSFLLLLLSDLILSAPYFGERVGVFTTHFNDVRGEVYALDDKTLLIKGFNYAGNGEEAFFWAGSSAQPDNSGYLIPIKASTGPLAEYHNQDLILRLPDERRVSDIRWLSVWSKLHSASFGTLVFPENFHPPQPAVIGPLTRKRHAVASGDILVLDTQTFLIPDFSYDGTGKGAYWWLTKGTKPQAEGLRLYEENGKITPLGEYINKTVIITLPDGKSVLEYGVLSIWSAEEENDYGSVLIPQNLKVPPSPRALGIPNEFETVEYNCEMLNDNSGLEIRWAITGNDIIMRLVGNIDYPEYMALGLSKDDTETKFNSADAVVAWLDSNGQGHAEDYFFENAGKCENGHGICPDDVYELAHNSLTLINATKAGNATIITFKRSLKAEDDKFDQNIYTDGPQAILWALGTLQDERLPETPKLQSRGNLLLDFGREPNWNCPPPKEETFPPKQTKESNFQIYCPNDRIFRAQMGPSSYNNGKNVWFINGIKTPELIVQRGITYSFIVEGGENAPQYHPLYITSNKEGGLYHSILEGRNISEEMYAGIQHDVATNSYMPTAVGRLCKWRLSDEDPEFSITNLDQSVSSSPLVLHCENGEAGKLVWTPNGNTPDIVYYQSFMEKNIGGQITVLDDCEETIPLHYLENETEKPNYSHTKTKDFEREYNGDSLEIKKGIKTVEREDSSGELVFLPFALDIEGNSQNREWINEEKYILTERQKHDIIHGDISLENDPVKNKMINTDEKTSYFLDSDVISDVNISNATNRNNIANISIVNESSGSEAAESLHPHDESERSDTSILHHPNSHAEVVYGRNKISVRSHSHSESPSVNKQVYKFSSVQNNQPLVTQPLQGFKPQFEGGFVPLVLNSGKEKESVLSKDFILPPPSMRRPHRPFLFNESIPFHGTFKPGVPDFSGFNISNYSQEDASVPVEHAQDNLPLLSAPKPQLIQRPIAINSGLPPELFQRPKEIYQRPQILGYGPPQHFPSHESQRQRVFAQPSLRNRFNVRIPNSNEEDLIEVSSQRVQISLQTPEHGKGKNRLPVQVLHAHGQTHESEQQSNKAVYPLPIQRRPDFVENGEAAVGSVHLKPQHKKHYQQMGPPNFNKVSQLQHRVPSVSQGGGLQRQPLNHQRSPPGARAPFRGVQHHSANGRRPSGSFIKLHPFIHRSHRERIQDVPVMTKEFPVPASTPAAIMIESMPDSSHSGKDKSPFHSLPAKANIKLASRPDESTAIEEIDASASNDRGVIPLLLNHDVMKLPNKYNRPQVVFIRGRPKTPSIVLQGNHPQNQKNTLITDNVSGTNVKTTRTQFPDSMFQPVQPLTLLSPQPRNPPSESENVKGKKDLVRKEPVDLIRNIILLPQQPGFADSFFRNATSASQKYITDTHFPTSDVNKTEENALNKEIQENASGHKSEIYQIQFRRPSVQQNNIQPGNLKTDIAKNEAKADRITINVKEEYSVRELESTTPPQSSAVPDYNDYDVPFGARLTNVNNDDTIQSKPQYKIPKSPSDFLRKPQFPPTKDLDYALLIPKTVSTVRENNKNTEKNISPVLNQQNQNDQVRSDIHNKASHSPVPNMPSSVPKEENASYSLFNIPSSSDSVFKLATITTKEQDSASSVNYPGRRNILPNNLNNVPMHVNVPPTVPENLHLPHISENPPTHDNGTDYSILNHVLSLINIPSSSNSRSAQDSHS